MCSTIRRVQDISSTPSEALRTRPRGVAVNARGQKRRQVGGGGFGGPTPQLDGAAHTAEEGQRPPPPANLHAIDDVVRSVSDPVRAQFAAAPPAQPSAPLPSVSRQEVLGTCVRTSALLAVFGLGLHQLAPVVSPAAHDGSGAAALRALLDWPGMLSPAQGGVAAAAAAGVTAARVALLTAWPSFREATERSNRQVLTPLRGALDLALVTVLPALSEELLFRGALLPAVYPDWRGAVVAGAVFGALHVNGGRNAAYAAWAGAVGCAYGAAFLATGNLWVPALAHAGANVAAGALWLRQRQPLPVSQSSKW